MSVERRKFPRIEVCISVIDQEREQTLGAIRDISIGGCFVETDNPLPKDSVVNIKFITPVALSEIYTRGRVASLRTNPHGIGIEFYAMAPEYRSALRYFIKKELGTINIKDRRQDRRIDLAISVFTIKGEKIGITKNLSVSSCLVKLITDYTPPALETELDIKFTIPGSKKEIIVKALAARLEERAFVAKFTSISAEDKVYIETLIKDLSTENFDFI